MSVLKQLVRMMLCFKLIVEQIQSRKGFLQKQRESQLVERERHKEHVREQSPPRLDQRGS